MAFPGASPPASGASPVGMSRDISPGSGAALAPAPSTSVFIHRLAGIRELFLLLYLASAARQALGSCIPMFHRPWNGAGDGLSRTDSSSSALQPWGHVPLVPPRSPKMFLWVQINEPKDGFAWLSPCVSCRMGVPRGRFLGKKAFLAGMTGPAWTGCSLCPQWQHQWLCKDSSRRCGVGTLSQFHLAWTGA